MEYIYTNEVWMSTGVREFDGLGEMYLTGSIGGSIAHSEISGGLTEQLVGHCAVERIGVVSTDESLGFGQPRGTGQQLTIDTYVTTGTTGTIGTIDK